MTAFSRELTWMPFKVMFLSALFCVCLIVSRITQKVHNRFSKKNLWKGGSWATEETVRFRR